MHNVLDGRGWFIRPAKVKAAPAIAGEDPSAHACCWRETLTPCRMARPLFKQMHYPHSCQSHNTSQHQPSTSSDWLRRFTCKFNTGLLMGQRLPPRCSLKGVLAALLCQFNVQRWVWDKTTCLGVKSLGSIIFFLT